MIADHIRNSTLYFSLNSGFKKGFKFINDFHEHELPDGRYEVDGENVYAMVQSYETSQESEKQWETHKKYVDLQYVVRGEETIYWSNEKALTPCTEYNAEKDLSFHAGPQGTGIKLSDGYFTILFPEDAHKPGCICEEKQAVKKIVVKLKV